MKLKHILMSLVALITSSLIAAAQSTPAGDTNQPAATPAAAPAAAPAATAPQDSATATTNAAAPTAVPAATSSPADTAAATNAPAEATAAAPPPSNLIPLIVMDEVPLTDAIKNLARQASLNYMLDPKIPYGSVGPDGRTNPQPSVSLRWENLTADQALGAVLNNYNLTIVSDPKTKISRITVKDPAAPDPLVTKIIQLKYSDPTNIVVSVQSVLLDKRSKVIADVRTSQLVVVATEKEVAAVDELVTRLDTQTKEVLIEAKLVELSKNPTTQKGIDWSGTLQAQHFGFGNNVVGGHRLNAGAPSFTQTPFLDQPLGPGTPVETNGFVSIFNQTFNPNNLLQSPGLLADTSHGFNPATAFLDADGVSAVLSFLNTDADAKVLSTPRAVTLDNQEAVLTVTRAQPIFLTTAGTQGSPGGSQVTYTNLGTTLRVTPRISANDTINLKVVPEVSDLGGTVTKTVSGQINQADFFDVRRIETRVLIPSGNTLVMGGLVSDSSTKGNTKVPFLGDIPVLGWAFRQEAKSQNKKNLLIFITPTIVQNEDFQPTQTDFLKTKLTDGGEVKFGAWDKGTPQDWSKLIHGNKPDPNADADIDLSPSSK